MNRATLTEELIRAKKDSTQKTEDIIKLKTTLNRWKTYVPLATITVALVSTLGFHNIDNKWANDLKELKTMTELANSFMAKAKQLETDLNYMYNNSSMVYVSKEDLLNDLMKYYPEVSTKVKITILETILSEAEKYNMNPLILYSLIYVESSFRHWLEHEPTTIDKGGKKIKIRAVGLTGIVWEWWGDKLRDAGIAETRGDLFDPVINIKAGAFVYNEMYKMEMHKSANYKDESALLRYFGGDFISYVQRIDAKIATFVRPNLFRKN